MHTHRDTCMGSIQGIGSNSFDWSEWNIKNNGKDSKSTPKTPETFPVITFMHTGQFVYKTVNIQDILRKCCHIFVVPSEASHCLEEEANETPISIFHSTAMCLPGSWELSITLSLAWLLPPPPILKCLVHIWKKRLQNIMKTAAKWSSQWNESA